jgi:hypothetical protein
LEFCFTCRPLFINVSGRQSKPAGADLLQNIVVVSKILPAEPFRSKTIPLVAVTRDQFICILYVESYKKSVFPALTKAPPNDRAELIPKFWHRRFVDRFVGRPGFFGEDNFRIGLTLSFRATAMRGLPGNFLSSRSRNGPATIFSPQQLAITSVIISP